MDPTGKYYQYLCNLAQRNQWYLGVENVPLESGNAGWQCKITLTTATSSTAAISGRWPHKMMAKNDAAYQILVALQIDVSRVPF